jgi:hypothetical protein
MFVVCAGEAELGVLIDLMQKATVRAVEPTFRAGLKQDIGTVTPLKAFGKSKVNSSATRFANLDSLNRFV